jgi:hypothetical protein
MVPAHRNPGQRGGFSSGTEPKSCCRNGGRAPTGRAGPADVQHSPRCRRWSILGRLSRQNERLWESEVRSPNTSNAHGDSAFTVSSEPIATSGNARAPQRRGCVVDWSNRATAACQHREMGHSSRRAKETMSGVVASTQDTEVIRKKERVSSTIRPFRELGRRANSSR